MSVTVNQLETVLTSAPFLQRVAFALGAICQNIESESAGTALHAQRVRLASQIVANVTNYTAEFAAQIVTQLVLATTNMVTVNTVPNADVDTTDAALQTVISSIYNDFITS
jgi:hypothetical protein